LIEGPRTGPIVKQHRGLFGLRRCTPALPHQLITAAPPTASPHPEHHRGRRRRHTDGVPLQPGVSALTTAGPARHHTAWSLHAAQWASFSSATQAAILAYAANPDGPDPHDPALNYTPRIMRRPRPAHCPVQFLHLPGCRGRRQRHHHPSPLSAASPLPVHRPLRPPVTFTAIAGPELTTATSNTLTFQPGQTIKTFTVPILRRRPCRTRRDAPAHPEQPHQRRPQRRQRSPRGRHRRVCRAHQQQQPHEPSSPAPTVILVH